MAFPKLSSIAAFAVIWGTQLTANQVLKPTKQHRNDLLSNVTFFDSKKSFEPLSLEAIESGSDVGGLEASLSGKDIFCRFSAKPLDGSNPNFHCLLSDKHGHLLGKTGEKTTDDSAAVELKVKYRPLKTTEKILRKYKENITEVFASEVFRSLGFVTDSLFPTTSVTCIGCSEDPFATSQKDFLVETKNTFADASVEIPYSGVSIVDSQGHGFSFKELEDLRKKMNERSRTEFEAVAALAGFLVHSQNSAAQQRLVCPKDKVVDNSCTSRPIGYVSELGSVMGSQNLIVSHNKTKGNLADWSTFPLWYDKSKCTLNLLFHGDQTFSIPSRITVSKKGKDLLVERMQSLVEDPKYGDQRLRALFKKAKFQKADEFMLDLDEAESTERWVSAFKAKYYDLKGAICPESVN